MHDAAALPLATWESFYVIVGSAAAALTGLQFVVMALIADMPRRSTFEGIDAFGTPTIVHFSAALFTSAVLSAPWPTTVGPAWILGLAGASGLGYALLVIRRARRQHDYKPVLEDWIWHTILPFIAYAALFGAAIALRRVAPDALFVIAASALLLLFIGIHNSWDTVTYVVTEMKGAGAN